ncbi:MAG: cation:proton antiporter [Rhodobacteraceae bacterium]|nr:cation:proton antiporter [Paracoccaceae bacterium]
MEHYAQSLTILGVLFLAGLAADQLGQKTRLPRITLLLACGMIAGHSGFGIIPDAISNQYELISTVALTMVAFLLGGSLSFNTLKARGLPILAISVSIVVVTLVLVSAGMVAVGLPLGVAMVLAAIASATAPAATLDVIRQSGVTSPFTETVKGIVAIDDAWGLLVFSVIIVSVGLMDGNAGGTEVLLEAVVEILGSILLGLVIGLPAAYLTGRLSEGEPLRIEALGLVCLTSGLALLFDLSVLIAGMTVGATIVNLARHHTKAFHEIEHIQWPFMVIFFILAGATLELEVLRSLGLVGVTFIALRSVSRLIGGWLGAVLAGVPRSERAYYGPALLPQAGVAIGMSLVAGEALPSHAELITAMTIGATVIFELVGPLCTSWAIRQTRKDH